MSRIQLLHSLLEDLFCEAGDSERGLPKPCLQEIRRPTRLVPRHAAPASVLTSYSAKAARKWGNCA